jgi:hypothetical protein
MFYIAWLLFMSIRWDYVYEPRPPTGILFTPQMIYEYGAMVEWYWQRKTEELDEELSPVLLFPPQIPHGLTGAQTCVMYFFPEGGVGQTQAWMPTYVSILRIPQMSLESDGGMIYWQGKTEELGDKPVPVPLCSPQIPHGLTRAWTRASAVRGRRLTTWAMAWPLLCSLLGNRFLAYLTTPFKRHIILS